MREIIERVAKEQPASRIGALYNSFMDTKKIEADGLGPLLKEVAPIPERADPQHAGGHLRCSHARVFRS